MTGHQHFPDRIIYEIYEENSVASDRQLGSSEVMATKLSIKILEYGSESDLLRHSPLVSTTAGPWEAGLSGRQRGQCLKNLDSCASDHIRTTNLDAAITSPASLIAG
ncbi:hypothetical protein OIDMADRAFT_24684 [Oidiodendron maius Zn]|uniref:Uncharacterized protein n=1 Tax=Oidiodendron maius (strain Zn) TaxID=913774 RepID=A0A0C3DW89_OIDMZ|nr:hypothetical protein OIDMADRAFT_24684 [Oidiodendron maius Zn]